MLRTCQTTHHTHSLALAWCCALVFVLTTTGTAMATNKLPQQLNGVQVQKSLGQQIAMNLRYTDSEGKARSMQDFFDGKTPVLLTLNYFKCPMLCTMQLNGVVDALKKIPPAMRKQFRVVTLSFNAKETAALAKKKRANYLKMLGVKDIRWDFLVGEKKEILRLTKSLGFHFRYVPKQKQFAHPAVVYLLTGKGKVSQYLSGIKYNPRDLRFSLITASQGQIGTLVDRFVMSCFVYSVVDGKYTAFAFGVVRLGGGLTVCFLVIFLGVFWLRERKRQVVEKST